MQVSQCIFVSINAIVVFFPTRFQELKAIEQLVSLLTEQPEEVSDYKPHVFNPVTSKIWLLILPSSCYIFPFK